MVITKPLPTPKAPKSSKEGKKNDASGLEEEECAEAHLKDPKMHYNATNFE